MTPSLHLADIFLWLNAKNSRTKKTTVKLVLTKFILGYKDLKTISKLTILIEI